MQKIKPKKSELALHIACFLFGVYCFLILYEWGGWWKLLMPFVFVIEVVRAVVIQDMIERLYAKD